MMGENQFASDGRSDGDAARSILNTLLSDFACMSSQVTFTQNARDSLNRAQNHSIIAR